MAGKLPPTDRPAEPSGKPTSVAPSTAGAAGTAAPAAPAERTPDRPERLRALLRARPSSRQALAFAGPIVAAFATLWLVIPTLAPGVYWGAGGDTAEFQTVGPVLGTAHPTGYPAYVVLGFVFTHVFPFGEPAFLMNLLQALLAAGAVAGTAAVVQFLTGMRWVALATGLSLLVMPAFTTMSASFPIGTGFPVTPVFWRLSTYADPHMFHLALVTLIFLLLLTWERRRTAPDPDHRRGADRWLVAAAAVYGIAFANHSLTLMLAPAVGLFVLTVAPRIILQWRLVLACAAGLFGMIALFWLELPIRAAMHAPLVYGHPDTWNGFWYVVMGQQFGGIPPTVTADLGAKLATVTAMISSWLGPLGLVAAVGLGTSLARRPRFVLLSVLSAVTTSAFAAAYQNSDLERYYLVPVFVAFTFVGLGLADGISLIVQLAESIRSPASSGAPAEPVDLAGAPLPAEGRTFLRVGSGWLVPVLATVEVVVAVALLSAGVVMAPDRQQTPVANRAGGVSLVDQTGKEAWMRAVLAPPEEGGLPANAVIVSNWSDSTTLWYGQRVDGLRPDIYIVDDSSRVKAVDNLGEVWDVIDRYLGQRPVFLLRFSWNPDGMDNLRTMYDMEEFPLNNGDTIPRVISKKGQQ